MPKKPTEDLELADLIKRADKARALRTELRALFPEAHIMPKDDRRSSTGKIGADESVALQSVVDAIDLEPALFRSLADEDEGHDPERLETELIRSRFAQRDAYAKLAAEIGEVQQALADAALALGALVVPVTRAAYEIAKPVSRRNAALRAKIAPALEYYGANAAAAVASRKAKKDAKDAG